MTPRPLPRALRNTIGHTALLCGALLLALPACTTTRGAEEQDPIPLEPDAEKEAGPTSIGLFLSEINNEIRAWTNLTMTAIDSQERRNALLLEKDLMRRTYQRRDELIHELEFGPAANRVVAASALGFTRAPEALSPLLAALEDPVLDVQSNALLGLSLLGQPDTPLERICELIRASKEPWVRANAAMCASGLVNAGARADCMTGAARAGLLDAEPGVRSQCALILATLLDEESMDVLEDLLYDEVPLVASAAARSVAYIGAEVPAQKAIAAKALVKAYIASERAMRRNMIDAMTRLSGRSFGDDEDEWREWALRLQ
jgi:HEAT repeat protein